MVCCRAMLFMPLVSTLREGQRQWQRLGERSKAEGLLESSRATEFVKVWFALASLHHTCPRIPPQHPTPENRGNCSLGHVEFAPKNRSEGTPCLKLAKEMWKDRGAQTPTARRRAEFSSKRIAGGATSRRGQAASAIARQFPPRCRGCVACRMFS